MRVHYTEYSSITAGQRSCSRVFAWSTASMLVVARRLSFVGRKLAGMESQKNILRNASRSFFAVVLSPLHPSVDIKFYQEGAVT